MLSVVYKDFQSQSQNTTYIISTTEPSVNKKKNKAFIQAQMAHGDSA